MLSNKNITYVISSPYKRAMQTVEGIANHFGVSILLEKGFRERKLSDCSVIDFQEVILKYWKNFDFSLPGGESGYTAQDRGVQSIKNVLGKYCGENIVIGTHGNIMVLIMNYYDKKYNYDFWNRLNMPDIYRLIFEDLALVGVEHIWS